MGVLFDIESLTIRYIDEDGADPTDNQDDGNAAGDIPSHPRAPRSAAPSFDNAAMMHFMTQQFSNLQTSMSDQWTSAREQMQKNHNDSTAHINSVQTEIRHNFSYLYSHLHILPYDPNNPAAPIPPIISVQAVPPQNQSNIPPNSSSMDLS